MMPSHLLQLRQTNYQASSYGLGMWLEQLYINSVYVNTKDLLVIMVLHLTL